MPTANMFFPNPSTLFPPAFFVLVIMCLFNPLISHTARRPNPSSGSRGVSTHRIHSRTACNRPAEGSDLQTAVRPGRPESNYASKQTRTSKLSSENTMHEYCFGFPVFFFWVFAIFMLRSQADNNIIEFLQSTADTHPCDGPSSTCTACDRPPLTCTLHFITLTMSFCA